MSASHSGTANAWSSAPTRRQLQVAEAIISDQSNKQIVRNLDINPATVEDHVHAILTRIGLNSRIELIAAQLENQTR